ncbi:MAG: hypothetical protein RLZZ175_2957 [Bacteroidota bacterium]|jgi:MazG family protein
MKYPDSERAQKLAAFDRLLTIMDELRNECPWDKKQTIESIRHLTIEETFELSDAILNNDLEEIKKELGDILLHIVFYSKIASETNQFSITDVIHSLCDKLVERHPHIYGNVIAEDEEAVKLNWEQIKQKEKGRKEGVMSGVPSSMPPLLKALRIQEKARGVGFDWENSNQVWDKVTEELGELQEAISNKDEVETEKEFGDVIFALVNYARFIKVNPEDALEKTNRKFISRFTFMENEIKKQGKIMKELTLDEMDDYWNQAKLLE